MIKISEIEDRGVKITNGDFIEVVVNNVDRSQRKIFLSLRR
jgi:ribosomal protein S1